MKRFRRSIAMLLALLAISQAGVLPAYAQELNVDETAAIEVAQKEGEDIPADSQGETLPVEPETTPQEPETVPQETEAGDTAEVPEETLPQETEAETQETVAERTLPDVPWYLQTDYPQVPYGEGTVGADGSAITSLAMVASYLTEHRYSPRALAEYFGQEDWAEPERLEYASDMLRLPWSSAGDWQTALDALENGSVVIAQMGSGSIFTNSQHFVVLVGVNSDGRIVVNDPYGPHKSQQPFAAGFRDGFTQEQISEGYVSGWIYDDGIMPDEPYVYQPEPPQSEGMPLYDQTAYPDVRYGDGSIATSGCGIVSLAMVATYLTGHTYLPETLADYFGGFTGNNVQRFENAAEMLQLPWRKAVNWHEVEKELKAGNVAVVLVDGRSIFTTSQHFLVIKGLTSEGRVLVNDAYGPNYRNPELKDGFTRGFASGLICEGYQGAWIFDVNAMPEDPFIYEEEPLPYVEPRYPELHLTAGDMDLLARMVWVEARGEEFDGQQAVAEVVLNRVVSGQFQDTVRGVIYADNQFRSTKFLDDATPTQTQYEAVEQALYGPYVLPLDVMHFARYAVNENVWGTIGGHIFCYQWEK